MPNRKPSKKALARHELYLRLFGYCRGKCGLPHPELRAKPSGISGSRSKTKSPLGKVATKRRTRGQRRKDAIALNRLAPLRSSWITDPAKMTGPIGRPI